MRILFFSCFCLLSCGSLWAQTAVLTLDRNVFHPTAGSVVTMTFRADYSGRGRLVVYNSAGESIRTLLAAGGQVDADHTYRLTWDGKNQAGDDVAP
ncbi:MAG TPA: hypothetical protein VFR02_05185, partial [bacterium]|nr:hypothetical protein [bacterium]